MHDDDTARTCVAAATQRAVHLAVLGVKKVLELCVGPSLSALTRAYASHGVSVVGNDIDRRWVAYACRYGGGAEQWRIGDALEIDPAGCDAVVFAPPLSRGCTGRREDSLRVDEVTPGFGSFLQRAREIAYARVAVAVMTLPGRAFATHVDRHATYRLLSLAAYGWSRVEVVPLFDARGRVVKYHDVYLTGRLDAACR